jgi:hypothetical protein
MIRRVATTEKGGLPGSFVATRRGNLGRRDPGLERQG